MIVMRLIKSTLVNYKDQEYHLINVISVNGKKHKISRVVNKDD